MKFELPTLNIAWPSCMRRRDRDHRSAPLVHEWTEAEALWASRVKETPAPDAAIAARLQALFYRNNSLRRDVDWSMVNTAERLIALVLSEAQLSVQYQLLHALATQRKLSSLTSYPDDAAFRAKLEAEKRAIYGALLYELQSRFIEGRFIRQLRNQVADTLWRYGLFIALLAAAVPILWAIHAWNLFEAASAKPTPPPVFFDETVFILAVVAVTGSLGAFFSRAMRFQTDIAVLSFDAVVQTYVARILRLRLLYGALGTVIFYFFIRGEFVKGSLFPTLQAGVVAQQTAFVLGVVKSVAPAAHSKSAAMKNSVQVTTALSPTVEFAKLLVWSFLAGFSERLLPDALAQIEKSQDAKAATK